ncbi:unnamed protein product [Saimiriine gammaherpesvirus 2]|uniref:Cytoplasmic envelopment protein 3 n=1 Tax=Saimiriine herpesvirus 2 (strain 11) TaxID=10383 RepID=CEP3_SHV21|nr:unnamed protein product [Saimiriine gammaherpesvirus 2]Q01025.3 RecName: Full=Cytoplasmic envelopment protein 3 [Herpesvirus saimiri (strain 11)]pir/I36809/ hypothetical protein ORF38 - saimiriine herpesvirus 1 (strain 11) [Saimiriine alphaherpesvirus 1]CAA45661.1 unnamed protein product [Saimiriine gammaherpesvirus 2]
MGTLCSVCKRRPNPVDTEGKVINVTDDFEEMSETEIMLACPQDKKLCKKPKESMYKTKHKSNKHGI